MQKHIRTSFCFRYFHKPRFQHLPNLPYDNAAMHVKQITELRES